MSDTLVPARVDPTKLSSHTGFFLGDLARSLSLHSQPTVAMKKSQLLIDLPL